MRAIRIILTILTFMSASTYATNYTEPNTGISFDTSLSIEEIKLTLTGADRRIEWGKDVYVIAHYVQHTSETSFYLEEELQHYIDSTAPKALILKGTNVKVPARGIRWAWNKGLKEAGYKNSKTRKSFVKTFNSPFSNGDALLIDLTESGIVRVKLNNKLLGEWNDSQLGTAIWEMCLGPNADLVNRNNLTRLK